MKKEEFFMKIVLLNKDNHEIQNINDSLANWSISRKINLEIENFHSMNQLIQYLLINKTSPIVLLIHDDFIEAIHDMEIIRILTKSKCLDFQRLFDFLDKINSVLESDKIIPILTTTKIIQLKQQEILYVEVNNHTITYHTFEEHISTRGSMKNILTQLGKEHFIQIHRSYAISKKNIFCIKKTYPYAVKICCNDEKIELPVSRNRINDLIEIYK